MHITNGIVYVGEQPPMQSKAVTDSAEAIEDARLRMISDRLMDKNREAYEELSKE